MPEDPNAGKHILRFDDAKITQKAPFTEQGMARLTSSVLGYADELIVEAARNAKRQGTDNISASHVDAASQYLVASNPGRRVALLGSFGGLLVGAALSETVLMINGEQVKPMTAAVTVTMGLVGSFLMALQWAKR